MEITLKEKPSKADILSTVRKGADDVLQDYTYRSLISDLDTIPQIKENRPEYIAALIINGQFVLNGMTPTSYSISSGKNQYHILYESDKEYWTIYYAWEESDVSL